jgi:hypothetical protein
MIDHFALALGHALLALAMLRLLLRDGLDDDPLIGAIRSEGDAARRTTNAAGRSAARRARATREDAGETGSKRPAGPQ